MAIRPRTVSTISGKHSMVERVEASARPPWFDTMMPSTPASTARAASSAVTIPLMRTCIDVLLAHLAHVIPGEAAPVIIAPGDVEALVHGPDALSVVTNGAFPHICFGKTLHRLAVAPAQKVDGEHDRRTTGALRARHDGLGHIPAIARMELIPDGLAPRFHDVFDRSRLPVERI